VSLAIDARGAFTADFRAEMALTRDLLERVPVAALDWGPHPRSFSLGGLATHLAELPHWGAQILGSDHYDLAGGSGRHASLGSTDAILETFDRHVSEVARAFAAQSDESLETTWTLCRGQVVLLALTRLDALRRFLLHHVIHHRGQLTVYLRLLEIPLTPLYGPTADKQL
jgi:uncharacterized damage-inducible protein DinB